MYNVFVGNSVKQVTCILEEAISEAGLKGLGYGPCVHGLALRFLLSCLLGENEVKTVEKVEQLKNKHEREDDGKKAQSHASIVVERNHRIEQVLNVCSFRVSIFGGLPLNS